VCIDICNQIGRFLPSDPVGQIIKQSQLQTLFVRGFLIKEFTESFGISYWRFSVSESGKQYFEEYKNNAFKCKLNKIEAALKGQPLLTEEWFDGSVVQADNSFAFNELNKHSAVFKDYPFLTQEWHEYPADRTDVEFIFNEVSKVADPIKRIILNNVFKIKPRELMI